jgi:hypothetical protein
VQGPSNRFRKDVKRKADELTREEELEELLVEIDGALNEDADAGAPEDDLAAIESWASLASYAAGRFYAPASPWPRDLAGWGTKAIERLRRIANTLASRLRSIVGVVGATGFSITVGFPWGISVALNW